MSWNLKTELNSVSGVVNTEEAIFSYKALTVRTPYICGKPQRMAEACA